MKTHQILGSEFKKALANDQFALYFRPKYFCTIAILHGAETIIRWHHPVKESILPEDLIPATVKNSTHSKVTYSFIEQVIRHFVEWSAKVIQKPNLIIKLSPSQLKKGLYHQLEKFLYKLNFPHKQLESTKKQTSPIDQVDMFFYKEINAIKTPGIEIIINNLIIDHSILTQSNKTKKSLANQSHFNLEFLAGKPRLPSDFKILLNSNDNTSNH